ncbi:Hypothetical Protein FCC1311_019122 [Hondaea fermentalgiana]|uniref:Uncharacterized protein n=1 Tax=Hondaea fermentalgiana TaxID=2315210 RepID=A0A2R5GAW7_9STRA|nr:Hypothetical Protein FCC1311_019122 [Hondaea fermentalgiana]|eukprot:GBG25693.1 Hypothetical Protein FCC1311_019122 [Hondaea fermentalgiana]
MMESSSTTATEQKQVDCSNGAQSLRCVGLAALETCEAALGALIRFKTEQDPLPDFVDCENDGTALHVAIFNKHSEELFRGCVYKCLAMFGGLETIKKNGMFFSSAWESKYRSEAHLYMVETERHFLHNLLNEPIETAKAIAIAHRDRFIGTTTAPKNPNPGDLHERVYKVFWEWMMGNKECRAGLSTFISKERSAFTKMIGAQAQDLECMLRGTTQKQNTSILSFAGVPAELMPDAKDLWMPHALHELLPTIMTQAHGCNLFSVDPERKVTGVSGPCATIALVMAWTASHILSQSSTAFKAFAKAEKVTFAAFFKLITPAQLAWVWTLLIRRGHGKTSGSRKHCAAATHATSLFERCFAYILEWNRQLKGDTRTFSIRAAFGTLHATGDKKRKREEARVARHKRPRKVATIEEEAKTFVLSASQDPF